MPNDTIDIEDPAIAAQIAANEAERNRLASLLRAPGAAPSAPVRANAPSPIILPGGGRIDMNAAQPVPVMRAEPITAAEMADILPPEHVVPLTVRPEDKPDITTEPQSLERLLFSAVVTMFDTLRIPMPKESSDGRVDIQHREVIGHLLIGVSQIAAKKINMPSPAEAAALAISCIMRAAMAQGAAPDDDALADMAIKMIEDENTAPDESRNEIITIGLPRWAWDLIRSPQPEEMPEVAQLAVQLFDTQHAYAVATTPPDLDHTMTEEEARKLVAEGIEVPW